MYSSLENICRTCMANEAKQQENVDKSFVKMEPIQMVSIFAVQDEIEERLKLMDLIKRAIPRLKIEENDRLPKIVCLDCLEKVKEMYKFQQFCLSNEKKLHDIFDEKPTVKLCSENDDQAPVFKIEIDDTFVDANILNSGQECISDYELDPIKKPRSRSTNKQQMQHLLNLMKANKDIARGDFKGSKQVLSRFWRRAEAELNSIGPPTKCITEWKKVWADQKKYVRNKASQHLKGKKFTGVGLNKYIRFSATEEAIYNLIAVKSSGADLSAKIQDLNYGKSKNDATTPEDTSIPGNDASQMQEGELVEELVDYMPASNAKISSLPKLEVKKETSKNFYNALQDDVKIQKGLLKTIKKIEEDQKEQEQSGKSIFQALDKMRDNQQKHFETMEALKRAEIEEMRRHNTFMETLRTKEVEYKLKKNRMEMQLLKYKN